MEARDNSNGGGPSMVKLISREGHEFLVDRRCICTSNLIENILKGNFNFH